MVQPCAMPASLGNFSTRSPANKVPEPHAAPLAIFSAPMALRERYPSCRRRCAAQEVFERPLGSNRAIGSTDGFFQRHDESLAACVAILRTQAAFRPHVQFNVDAFLTTIVKRQSLALFRGSFPLNSKTHRSCVYHVRCLYAIGIRWLLPC